MIQFVKKRDGRTIAFNSDRITRAIFLAASKVAEKENSSADYSVSEKITQDVISLLNFIKYTLFLLIATEYPIDIAR